MWFAFAIVYQISAVSESSPSPSPCFTPQIQIFGPGNTTSTVLGTIAGVITVITGIVIVHTINETIKAWKRGGKGGDDGGGSDDDSGGSNPFAGLGKKKDLSSSEKTDSSSSSSDDENKSVNLGNLKGKTPGEPIDQELKAFKLKCEDFYKDSDLPHPVISKYIEECQNKIKKCEDKKCRYSTFEDQRELRTQRLDEQKKKEKGTDIKEKQREENFKHQCETFKNKRGVEIPDFCNQVKKEVKKECEKKENKEKCNNEFLKENKDLFDLMKDIEVNKSSKMTAGMKADLKAKLDPGIPRYSSKEVQKKKEEKKYGGETNPYLYRPKKK